jgi:periodic tryptophan protein 1
MDSDVDLPGGGKDDLPSHYSDSSEEKEDYTIRNSDSLIIAATAESDHSSLEVYLYDHKASDLYVHHEILLGSYPLCMEWLGHWQGKKTNHIIVGTFLPEIEIWNLDTEAVEPTAVLGSLEKSEKSKAGPVVNKYKKDDDLGTHTDAVMCLSLNPHQQEYLASGSEDSTVRIWDLDDLQCKATLSNLHKNKVQAVRWNLVTDNALLTAGYDSRVNVLDVRDQSSKISTKIPKEAQDIESAAWHPTQEHNFAISTESGMVYGYDTRKVATPVFAVQAHESACSNVHFSPHIPNMMATSSTDGTVKVWDILHNGGTNPFEMGSREMGQGELFSM